MKKEEMRQRRHERGHVSKMDTDIEKKIKKVLFPKVKWMMQQNVKRL